MSRCIMLAMCLSLAACERAGSTPTTVAPGVGVAREAEPVRKVEPPAKPPVLEERCRYTRLGCMGSMKQKARIAKKAQVEAGEAP